MRKLLVMSLLACCVAPLALGAAFPAVQANAILGDAGAFNTLYVDAGQFQSIVVGGFSTFNTQVDFLGSNNGVVLGGGATNKLCLDGVCTNTLNADSTGSGNMVLTTAAGIKLGSASFGAFKGQSFGTCTLASGTCNAVVPGASGASLCYAGVQGTYARDAGAFTCSVQADAGSATVYCQGAALIADPGPAPMGIHCDN